MSRTDEPSFPGFGHATVVVVAGVLAALIAGLLGPVGSAQARSSDVALAPPAVPTSPPSPPSPSPPSPPSADGAVGQPGCCAQPDPPRTPGVPYRWCVRHHKCWDAHQFVARHVKRFRDWRRDGVTHRILPNRFERKVRRLFASRCGASCTKTASLDRDSLVPRQPTFARDGGGYDDWVDDADCVVHGYGCYFSTNPRPELSKIEKTFLWCSGTVVVAGLPGGYVTLGEAGKACFWGAAYYWMGFWK